MYNNVPTFEAQWRSGDFYCLFEAGYHVPLSISVSCLCKIIKNVMFSFLAKFLDRVLIRALVQNPVHSEKKWGLDDFWQSNQFR